MEDLSKKNFDILDGGLACLVFVALQFVFYSVLPNFFYSNSYLIIVATILLEGVFALSAYIVAVSRKRNFVQATTIGKKFNWQIALVCLGVAFGGIIMFSQLSNAFAATLFSFGYQSNSAGISITSFWEYLLHIVVTCAVPAFCEELLFRGVVLNSFRNSNKWIGIFVSATMFMLMHANPDQTAHQLLLGFVLAFVMWETNNIWVPILIHFFNNFIAISLTYGLFLAGSGEEEETVAIISSQQIVGYWIVGTIMAIVGIFGVIWVSKFLKQQSEKANKKAQGDTVLQEESAEQLEAPTETEQTKSQEEKTKPNRMTILFTVLSYVAFSAYCIYEWIMLFIRGLH